MNTKSRRTAGPITTAIAAIVLAGAGVSAAAAPASAATTGTARPTAIATQASSGWTWYGYRLGWTETNRIADLSLWNAAGGVRGTRLIPYSQAIMATFAINWVLTARNARSMGQCLAISYAGVGLIVHC